MTTTETVVAIDDIVLLPFEDWATTTSEQKEKNSARKKPEGHDETWDDCIVCGRPIKPTAKSFWVHWSLSGSLYPVDISDEIAEQHPEGDQGWFAVGSNCATKIPAAYKSKGE